MKKEKIEKRETHEWNEEKGETGINNWTKRLISIKEDDKMIKKNEWREKIKGGLGKTYINGG